MLFPLSAATARCASFQWTNLMVAAPGGLVAPGRGVSILIDPSRISYPWKNWRMSSGVAV